MGVKTTQADAADRLLAALGWPARGDLDAASARLVAAYDRGRRKLVAVLARRGWVVALDPADPVFAARDGHAAAVGALLASAGATAAVAEERRGELGRVVRVGVGCEARAYARRRGVPPAAALDLALIARAAGDALEPLGFRLAELRPAPDGTPLLAAVPRRAWEHLARYKLAELTGCAAACAAVSVPASPPASTDP